MTSFCRTAPRRLPFSILLPCLAPAVLAQAPPTWANGHVPTPRSAHAMAYDEARARTVLFGGSELADTWEWDGIAWTPRATATAPAARYSHALAYDAARRRVLLFGGSDRNLVPFGDTWEWNGNVWLQRAAARSPAPRYGHTLAYDSVRQRAVLFGGVSGGAMNAETWEWDGNTWTQMLPGSPPGARMQAGMAFDAARARTVLFGGSGAGILGDTWEWDGTTWTAAAPTSAVTPRSAPPMAFDAALGRVVLHGGSAGILTAFQDAWEWLGTTWVPHVTTTPPPARGGGALVYDVARGRLVLHGGGIFDHAVDDTWEESASVWTQSTPTGPYARYAHALADDSVRGRVVLFGGRYPSLAQASQSDTWEWDGYRWLSTQPASSPSARNQHALAFDAGNQRTILFGGFLPATGLPAADTWSWDGTNWTQLAPATSPPPRAGHVMAYDTARQQVLLFSGSADGNTWTWNGSTWTQQFPLHQPSMRQDAGIAYDEARQVAVLYGGYVIPTGTSSSETWEWNGVDWTLRTPVGNPGVRVTHAMAYDKTRQRVAVARGATSLFNSTALTDAWEYDGVRWTLVTGGGPQQSIELAMAYDEHRRQLLLFGGSSSAGEIWFFGNATPARLDSIGAGCGGSGGAPILGGSLPCVGNRGTSVELIAAAPLAPALFGLSTTSASQPLGGGCTLLLGPLGATAFVVTSATGNARLGLPVPENPTLRGITLFAQGVVLDASGPSGLAFTGGLRLVVGD